MRIQFIAVQRSAFVATRCSRGTATGCSCFCRRCCWYAAGENPPAAASYGTPDHAPDGAELVSSSSVITEPSSLACDDTLETPDTDRDGNDPRDHMSQ